MKSWAIGLGVASVVALALEVPSGFGASVSVPRVDTMVVREEAPPPPPLEVAAEPVETIPFISEDTSNQLADGLWGMDCISSPCIALTFDDGPGPDTPQLLEILARYGARATFYPVGYQMEYWADNLSLIHEAGHEIGNHSMNHPYFSEISAAERAAEIAELDALVDAQIGLVPTSFRPPYGDLPRGFADTLSRPVVMWSVESFDWERHTPEQIIEDVLDNATPGDIILMHELRERTLLALPTILEGLEAKGLRVVAVEDLLGPARGEPGVVKRVAWECPELVDDRGALWCPDSQWVPTGN